MGGGGGGGGRGGGVGGVGGGGGDKGIRRQEEDNRVLEIYIFISCCLSLFQELQCLADCDFFYRE